MYKRRTINRKERITKCSQLACSIVWLELYGKQRKRGMALYTERSLVDIKLELPSIKTT